MVLVLTAIAIVTRRGLASIFNPGAHGFSEALYAYDSQANNNGSAFAGYGATEFSAVLGSIALWLGRFAPLIAALALGGALAAKKTAPPSAGTFRTDGATFAVLLVGVDHPHRRADDLPGAHARADRGGAVTDAQPSSAPSLAVVVLTVVFGLVYPLVLTGFAQLAFSDKANGSLIERDGKVVGSKLAAQAFTKPQYFHPRPSATAPEYNAAATTFANLGPTNPDLAKAVQTAGAARSSSSSAPTTRASTIGDIPVDAVTTSGSGIDPHISPANAQLQARPHRHRCAGLRSSTSQQLVDDNTDGRSLGFFGEPGVNVLELNLALDEESTLMARRPAEHLLARRSCSRRSATRSSSSTRARSSATRSSSSSSSGA